jgi:peptidyl-prolyl cis-trans isomerase SurA
MTTIRNLALAVAVAVAGGSATAVAQPAGDTQRNAVVLDRVVAVVNDDVILSTELMARVMPMVGDLDDIADTRERERRRRQLTEQILEEMVNENLMVQAAVEAGLDVSAKEVQAALDEIKKQNSLDDAGLEQALAMQGYTISAYKDDVRRQILRMRAVNSLVRPKVTITDEDVRARYDAMTRRSSSVTRVRLHHILISLPDNPTEKQLAAAKSRAGEVIEQARAGADFAELARQYSDDTSNASAGGDLGWIERGSITTEWEVIVFSMDQGEVRGPISGPQGLHVFYVPEVDKSDLQSFDELKEEIRNELYRKDMDKKTREWLDDLRNKAYIDTKL